MTLSHVTSRWFTERILHWHQQHGRHDLPWKISLTPYSTWVSEIMLQQTQVATVIPYFKRFMNSFPTVQKLAAAHLDQVLQHWAGLGYYARGRNLYKTAQILITEQQGKFPTDIEKLMSLPGIGRSTAGAILSQAFNISAPILDGNVKRVLSRFHCIDGHYSDKSVEATLWQLAQYYTPNKHVADYTQAIMDLGATLCTRTQPNCQVCPLRLQCQANLRHEQSLYPFKKPKKTLPQRHAIMLCILNKQGNILLMQRPSAGIWGGLFSLPEFPKMSAAQKFLQGFLGKKPDAWQDLASLKHTFTHFHLFIDPKKIQLNSPKIPVEFASTYAWYSSQALTNLGLPAPIKRIMQEIALI